MLSGMRCWVCLDVSSMCRAVRHLMAFTCACRFPAKARALADSIQAWHDMQEENAHALKNKLDATFILKTQDVTRQASVLSNDSRRESSESLLALGISGSPSKPLARSSSAKRAVLVAR